MITEMFDNHTQFVLFHSRAQCDQCWSEIKAWLDENIGTEYAFNLSSYKRGYNVQYNPDYTNFGHIKQEKWTITFGSDIDADLITYFVLKYCSNEEFTA